MNSHNFSLPPSMLIGGRARAEYPPLPGKRRNPLYDALPSGWERGVAMGKLRREIEGIDGSQRRLPMLDRMQETLEILDYFEPLTMHVRLERYISQVMRLGLKYRNPMDLAYYDNVAEDEKAVSNILNKLQSSQTYNQKTTRRRSLRLGACFLGDSGCGKSVSVENILLLYPQLIIHPGPYFEKPFYFQQILWVKLECPANGSLKALIIQFFEIVDAILGNDGEYTRELIKKGNMNKDVLMGKMARLVGIHGIGFIVIDEIQHLVGTADYDEVISFLEGLVNIVGVPIMIIGTEDAYEIASKTFSEGRRFTSPIGLPDWKRLSQDGEYDFFLECLWVNQFTNIETKLTQDLKRAFYFETQGIIDLIVKLYIILQIHAMELHEIDPNTSEEISVGMVHKLGQGRFKHLQDHLQKMRMGKDVVIKPEAIRKVDIQEIIAETVQNALNQKLSDLAMLKNQKRESKSSRKAVERTPTKETTGLREDHTIIPEGTLDAYIVAIEEERSKYEVLLEYGLIKSPLEIVALSNN